MRNWIKLFENQTSIGIGYHGTSSNFVKSILEHGLKSDPEFKNERGSLESYKGAYFSDTFSVALYRGSLTVEKVGGKTVVIVCDIPLDVAGDEDAITDFVREELWHNLDLDLERYKSDEEYRKETDDQIEDEFDTAFDSTMPSEFMQLLLFYLNGGNIIDDPVAKNLIDIISRKIGVNTRASGNYEAKSFRVPEGIDKTRILAVVECNYNDEDFDPSILPNGLTLKVIYGNLPTSTKKELSL